MKFSMLLAVCFVTANISVACKPRQSADATTIDTSKTKSKDDKNPGDGAGLENPDESGDFSESGSLDPTSASDLDKEIASKQKEIKALQDKLDSNDKLTAEEKADLQKQIKDLEAAKAKAEAALKALTDKQMANSKPSSTTAIATSTTSGGKGPSGFPYCVGPTYGDTFTCDPKFAYKCSKTDPGYSDASICQFPDNGAQAISTSTGSTPSGIGASGNPYCGQFYYGSTFTCNSKTCGKAKPDYTMICEITAGSVWKKGN